MLLKNRKFIILIILYTINAFIYTYYINYLKLTTFKYTFKYNNNLLSSYLFQD